jgi:hypothetical protein
MALRVVEQHVVYRDDRYYCGPGPSVVPSGTGLLAAFRRVPSWLAYGHSGHWHPATELCLTRSRDGGRTWSPPRVFLGGFQCPNLTRLSDGTLIHLTHRTELVPSEIAAGCRESRGVRTSPWPGIHVGTCTWRSEDDGETWEKPVYLDGVPGLTPLHANVDIPVAVRGNVLELRNGCLAVSAYSLDDPNSAYLFLSEDAGRSWRYASRIAESFNETYLCETESGCLLAFMRKWGGDTSILHVARSDDGGLTWSTPVPLCKGYPGCAVQLQDGRIFLAYGYRFDDRFGVRARMLTSGGDIDPSDKECIVRDDGAVVDLGYPDVTLLPDRRPFVIYYVNRRTDAPDGSAPRYIEACTLST